MPKLIDLTGKKFNRLSVLHRATNRGRYVHWRCACDCGRRADVNSRDLVSGHTKSCGCYMVDDARQRFTKHGMKGTKVYNAWVEMRRRCYTKSCKAFKDYGGRGITVCERWQDFSNFYEDMGTPPEKTSLDRIDNDGNYEAENCRWATRHQQNNNQRSNRMFEFGGARKSIGQWATHFEVSYQPLYTHLAAHNWNISAAVEALREQGHI